MNTSDQLSALLLPRLGPILTPLLCELCTVLEGYRVARLCDDRMVELVQARVQWSIGHDQDMSGEEKRQKVVKALLLYLPDLRLPLLNFLIECCVMVKQRA